MPVKIQAVCGFAIVISQLPICDFGQDLISNSQSIDKNLHLIKNEKSPVNIFGAVNKTYVDRVNIKQILVQFLILL